MTNTIRYEIAPIFNTSFLLADPVLRKHMVMIGILEYEKALLEVKELEQIEQMTQRVINKIQNNREHLVAEYESMMKCIRSDVISN